MLSKFSVKKPFTIVVAVVMVLILGSISFINLQTDLLPDIDLPYLVIATTYPGASPEEVETIVTRPIEQVVATASNIKNISSVSRDNSSLVILEFNNDVNMDSAIIEINSGLDLIRGMWDDSISSPMIIRLNPDMIPIMVSSVDIDGMDLKDMSNLVRTRIIPELESVEGVASVSGSGLLEERIEVRLDQEAIEELNKKILNKIDKQLAEAEVKLLEGKKEIEKGKLKLEEEEKKQMDFLTEAEDQVNKGIDQLSFAIDEIGNGIKGLNEYKDFLINSIETLKNNEDLVSTIKERLLRLASNLPGPGKERIEAIVAELDKSINDEEVLKDAINEIDLQIGELEKQLEELRGHKKEADSKAREIKSGRELLISEISKARTELMFGELKLMEGLEEFESSRDRAFKEASLDGVLGKDMISNILMAQNFSMPAGYLDEDGIDYLVKVGDKFNDLVQVESLLLLDTGEDLIGKIYLSDLAQVLELDNSGEVYAKINGNNALIMDFQKQSNFSTSQVSKNINKKMREIEEKNEGLSFTNLMDQGVYIGIVVKSVLDNIVYGGILAVAVLIFFLKAFKPTFIIAVSIPISIVFAIAMMYFSGVTINIISLAGLALGVGMLVDNSIVVIENIYRLRNEGMSATKAAVEGAREVSGAIVASTITTACVFLPIVFTKGISKQLFTDMGLTIAYSLFASLLVALTLVPTMGATILKRVEEKETKLIDRFIASYVMLLESSLKHKSFVLIMVVGLLVLSGFFAYSMGTSFIPEMDAAEMSISMSMSEDKTFEERVELVDKLMNRIIDIEDIETVGVFQAGQMMGFMGGGQSSASSMSMYLLLDEKSKKSNAMIGKEIEDLAEDLDMELSINSSNMDMTQLGGSGIQVQIRGRDLDSLRDIGLDVAEILEGLEGTREISSGIDKTSTEIRIVVDKSKAMENGLTVAQVFAEVSSLLASDKTATSLSMGNQDYPLIVIDEAGKPSSQEDLKGIKIKNMKDEEVELGDIVNIHEEKGLSSINRNSQERYISVTASIDEDHNIGLVSRELENRLRTYDLPEGYRIDLEGENKMIKDSLRDLIIMVALAIVFIYLIMVAQFQSLLSPFIVMFTIPLAFTGGLLALWLTGNNISLIAMLGFLVLSGVVVNNGIVFVDYTNQLRESGMKKRDALILTGKNRIRPILMTAITTILGLSTLSAGMGVGAEMLQPLAIVAIGGLVYATLLTLFVVPIMYDILHGEEYRVIVIEDDD